MEFLVRVFKETEWFHIARLTEELENFHGEIDTPYEEYDPITLACMECAGSYPALMLHLMWTNRMVKTDSVTLN